VVEATEAHISKAVAAVGSATLLTVTASAPSERVVFLIAGLVLQLTIPRLHRNVNNTYFCAQQWTHAARRALCLYKTVQTPKKESIVTQ